MQQLVGVYNQVMKTLGELRGSVLASERGALRSFESQFRSILNAKAGDGSLFSFASELGITTGRDSRLSLNTTVFNQALQTDPNGVADLFANDTSGLAARFEALAANLTGAGGALDSREQSLKSRIDRISTARSNMAFRLTAKEAALVQQYAALDSLVASLNTTSGFLSTQFARLSANGNRQ